MIYDKTTMNVDERTNFSSTPWRHTDIKIDIEKESGT
jgi:hypothetical protein